MSNSGDSAAPSAQAAFTKLEGVAGETLKHLATMTKRARAAEKEAAELNDLMRRFTGNPREAGEVLTKLKQLEDENQDLRNRLDEGRAGVERLLAKIRFLENQR